MKRNSIKYMVYINDLLGVESAADDFCWCFGKRAPAATKEDFDACLVKVRLDVVPDRDVISEEDRSLCSDHFRYFSHDPKNGQILYERPFPFGKKLSFRMRIKDNTVTATVGRRYWKYLKYRIMNLHSIGYMLSDIVAGLLLKNGYAPLYCAAVYFPTSARCALLFSAPGVGKTTTAQILCRDHGALLLSEDVAVTDGSRVFSAPYTASARRHAKETYWDRRVTRADIETLTANGQICDRADATDLFLLEHGEETAAKDACVLRRMSTLNRYMFPYRNAPIWLVLQYFDRNVSLSEMERMEDAIQARLASQTAGHILIGSEPASFSRLVCDTLMIENASATDRTKETLPL